MNDSRWHADNDRRRQVIPGYNKEEFENEKRMKRNEQEFEGVDNAPGTGAENRKFTEKSFADRHNTPTNVICVLNMAFEATEAMLWEEMKNDRLKAVRIITDRETRRPRGFAFCSFPSIVDASNIISKYPSSSGIGVGNPLVLCGQQCYIEYSTTVSDGRYDRKIDWICESCNTLNSGRRMKCTKCHYARTETCMDPERLMFEFSQTPTLSCLVKGLGMSAMESDIIASFSMHAPVQKAYIFRDELSGLSRGYALVEFDSVESASKVVGSQRYFTVKGIQVTIGYACPQCIRHAHNSIPYQAASAPMASMAPMAPMTPMNMGMYSYPMNMGMYSMYQQPFMYQMAMETFQNTSQTEQQEQQEPAVPLPVPAVRKKGESLAHSIRKMTDGRPYPADYANNSLNYIFDAQSGFYYDSQSQFYYCLARNLYLDSVSGLYYQLSNKELIPFTPKPPSYHVEDSIPQQEVKEEEEKKENNPIFMTPIQFQFTNTQTTHTIAKPKIEIKFKTDLNTLINETPIEEEKAVPLRPDPVYDFKPGQSVQIEYKRVNASEGEAEQNPEEEPEVMSASVEPPSLEQIVNITGWSRHGCPACYICRRRFVDEVQLTQHLEKSAYHQYWLKQWMAVHPEPAVYRNRAEERRKAVGSTAFTRPRRPIPQPVIQTPAVQASTPGTESNPTYPGKAQKDVAGPSAIGKMLLEKDGWLEKHEEEKTNPIENASIHRGGLGYQESKKSAYSSMILQGDSFLSKK